MSRPRTAFRPAKIERDHQQREHRHQPEHALLGQRPDVGAVRRDRHIRLELAGPDAERIGRDEPQPRLLRVEARGVVALQARPLAEEVRRAGDRDEDRQRDERDEQGDEDPHRLLLPPLRSATTTSIAKTPTAAFSHAARENEKRTPAPQTSSSRNLNGLRARSRRGSRISSSTNSASTTMNGPKMFGSWKPPCTRRRRSAGSRTASPPTNRASDEAAAQIGTPVIRSPSSTIRARRRPSPRSRPARQRRSPGRA